MPCPPRPRAPHSPARAARPAAPRRVAKAPPAVPRLLLLNEPFDVLTQFADADGRATLRISSTGPASFAAGRVT
ncbi:Pseudouridine synthase OS=Stutzerimonas stutzeri OX=316 GN=LO50_05620 PE=3 SV=1 [Stutzerimonas stutzeri]